MLLSVGGYVPFMRGGRTCRQNESHCSERQCSHQQTNGIGPTHWGKMALALMLVNLTVLKSEGAGR